MNNYQLAELILTKFCHDIAGITGALMNGAELVEESLSDEDFLKEASAALSESAKSLTYRLRFFRSAFGMPKQEYSVDTAACLARDYISTLNDITVSWEHDKECEFAVIRGLLILVMLAAGALTRGGEVIVSGNTVIARGTNTVLSEEIKLALMSDNPSVEEVSSNVAPALFLKGLGQKIETKISIDEVSFTIV